MAQPILLMEGWTMATQSKPKFTPMKPVVVDLKNREAMAALALRAMTTRLVVIDTSKKGK